ncbi:phage portal protein, partial [Romboutsia sp.]|uniref:phage portal protein n=1 Tax=Romboutsia sp. TaxID=1965302 RepID=UPI002C4B107A
MLTNLDFLKLGASFPPAAETERLEKYNKNKLVFEGKHEQVYKESFERIARVVNNFDNVVSYSVVANFQKLISLKIADFLLGEAPKIVAGDDKSKEQAAIDVIKENSDLDNTLYTSAIDISRYGDSVLNVYKGDEGKGIIDI